MATYVWNDFALKYNRPLKKDEKAIPQWTPCGTLRFDGRTIRPGETFEAEPEQIKALGPEAAAKCVSPERFAELRGLAQLPKAKEQHKGK